jgi:hypothetical protein
MGLTIKRVSIIDPGAFGVMLLDDVPFAVTLERTYDLDAREVVKIPPGIYRCTKTTYYKGDYPTYEIHVPGHSRILFHKANVETQLEGCIAIGEEFGVLYNKPAVLRSGRGFDEFMQKMSHLEYFDLTIE